MNPNYSVDNVDARLIVSEPYENYPDSSWAQTNHELRANYNGFLNDKGPIFEQ